MRHSLLIFFAVSMLALNTHSQNSPQVQINNSNWSATDALGRELPMIDSTGLTRENKYVGLFYFLWHGFHNATAIYDITKLIATNPDDPQYGPHHMFHWWGEPEAGYFRATDPWVIRRNLQLISDAGVDFLFLDATNAYIYLDAVFALCDISLQMRAEGLQTPYIVFHTHSNGAKTINRIFDSFYSHPKYRDLWFIWQGKPLIFGDKEEAGIYPEALDFFNFRFSWAYSSQNIARQWRWIDHTPQRFGWDTDPHVPEQITVSVAEHAHSNIGRSYHGGFQPATNKYKLSEFTDQGLFFDEQLEHALKVDPEVMMITGWNEWIAMRMLNGKDATITSFLGDPIGYGDTYFVDAYNQEYNRDIEPMKGGHTDNYYYQMVSSIRIFKGMNKPAMAESSDSITIDGNFSEWPDIIPAFKDPKGDTFHRNYSRYDEKENYVNTTGRNDIVETRTAFDSTNIYFYVKTAGKLTPHTDKNWMLLFINYDKNISTGWEGYDFAINMSPASNELSSLHSWQSSDSTWVDAGTITYKYNDNEMELSVLRAAISLADGTPNFQFHWADNIQKINDISEFFVNGDSAPDRRFSYNFESSTDDLAKIPNSPSNLLTSPVSGNQINLSWNDNSNNEEKFIVERSYSTEGTWNIIDSLSVNSTAYCDSALQQFKKYYYRIRAVNSKGSSQYSNTHGSTTFLLNVPQAPSNISADTVGNKVDLIWQDNSDSESGFKIELRIETNSEWKLIATTGFNRTSLTVKGLPNGIYYFRVKAFNDLGESESTDSVKVTIEAGNSHTWDFDIDTEGWTNTSLNIDRFKWKWGGYVEGTVTGQDPYITSPDNLGINISESKYIAIRMKNNGPANMAQFYFGTNTEPGFDESKSISFNITENDTDYSVYIVDLSGNPKWNGTLKLLRCDPSKDVASGIFYIDYINIQNSTTTDIEENLFENKSLYVLEQNFPNPFTKSTQIKYHIAKQGKVTLSVYNAIGQKIKVLVDNQQTPGSYSVTFKGEKFQNGIYTYLLNTGNSFSWKKMILHK